MFATVSVYFLHGVCYRIVYHHMSTIESCECGSESHWLSLISFGCVISPALGSWLCAVESYSYVCGRLSLERY